MIVTISKDETNAIKYACGLLDYKCSFYTNEKNEKLVQAVIYDEVGDEISVNMAWHIARQVELKIACDAFDKKHL